MTNDARLILLDEEDDVLVVIRPIRREETVLVEGRSVQAGADIGLGHKIARRALPPGAPIRKYGVPIGRATVPIRQGEHVHVHNVASNYTATYTLDHADPATGEN